MLRSTPQQTQESPVELIDLAPAPDTGYARTAVSRDGQQLATLHHVIWPGNLMVLLAEIPEGAPHDAHYEAVVALLRREESKGPTKLTHHQVRSWETLVCYRDGPFGDGLGLSGMYGSRGLTYDPLASVSLDHVPEAATEAHRPVDVIVTYAPELQEQWRHVSPSLEQVRMWLSSPDDLHRVATIRRIALDERLDRDVVLRAHLLAMLNENYAVRQFASMHVSGFSSHIAHQVDLDGLLCLLRDPESILDASGDVPQEHPWRRWQSRRNARYAALWTLGNVAWVARGSTGAPWMHGTTAQVRSMLEEAGQRLDAERDLWLYELALLGFGDHPDHRYALGVRAPVDLFDVLRFVVHRWRIVLGLGFKGTDRFSWLIDTAQALVDEDFDERQTLLGQLVYAPSPSDRLPEGLEQMPPWDYGENHHLETFATPPL
jgi:hypothetical protein